jgi:heme exporter protein D
LQPLLQAQKRRAVLPWYFDLGGKAAFLVVALAACLLALIALAQTGRVVSLSYDIRQLKGEEQQLIWEREDLLARLARAQDPATLEQWARENGMEPLAPGDVTFVTVPAGWSPAIAVSTLAREP